MKRPAPERAGLVVRRFQPTRSRPPDAGTARRRTPRAQLPTVRDEIQPPTTTPTSIASPHASPECANTLAEMASSWPCWEVQGAVPAEATGRAVESEPAADPQPPAPPTTKPHPGFARCANTRRRRPGPGGDHRPGPLPSQGGPRRPWKYPCQDRATCPQACGIPPGRLHEQREAAIEGPRGTGGSRTLAWSCWRPAGSSQTRPTQRARRERGGMVSTAPGSRTVGIRGE
jgi:hypothetical protein